MAQIPTYEREFSFTGHSEDYPARPHRGDKVDAEFDAVALALAATKTALAQIRRTDGQLKNLSVGLDQLKPEVVLGTPTDWTTATEYERKDVVWRNSVLYVCNTDHTSGTFATDLAAAYWTAYLDYADPLGDAADYANAARDYRDTAGGHAASTAANLSLAVAAREAAEAAQQAAEDAAAGITLPLDVTQGGSGAITPGGARTNFDVYSRAEVDALFEAIDIKASVACATTANITLSGEQTIDGVLTSASRVLVKDQSTGGQNGIYVSGAGAWSRASDANTWNEHVGAFVTVEGGSTNADRSYLCTNGAGGTLGTTAIVWDLRVSATTGLLALLSTTAIGRALLELSGSASAGHAPVYTGSAWASEAVLVESAIINGDFEVAQRGTSFTSATTPANSDDTYLFDRWTLLSDGNDIVDVTQETSTVPTGKRTAAALDVETVNKKFGIIQFIEHRDAAPLIGGNATLSFQAKVSATTKLDNLKAAIISWDGTADTLTSDVVSAWNAEGTNPTLVANWTYENTPVNLSPTTSYQTFNITAAIDTASAKNIAVFIWSDVTDTTLGDFLYITGVRLVPGSVARPAVQRPYAQELALALRFYWRIVAESLFLPFSSGGRFSSTTQCYAPIKFPQKMRAAPVLAHSAIGLIGVGGHADLASLSINMNGTEQCLLLGTLAAATAAAGQAGAISANNSTSAYIAFEAEL